MAKKKSLQEQVEELKKRVAELEAEPVEEEQSYVTPYSWYYIPARPKSKGCVSYVLADDDGKIILEKLSGITKKKVEGAFGELIEDGESHIQSICRGWKDRYYGCEDDDDA